MQNLVSPKNSSRVYTPSEIELKSFKADIASMNAKVSTLKVYLLCASFYSQTELLESDISLDDPNYSNADNLDDDVVAKVQELTSLLVALDAAKVKLAELEVCAEIEKRRKNRTNKKSGGILYFYFYFLFRL